MAISNTTSVVRPDIINVDAYKTPKIKKGTNAPINYYGTNSAPPGAVATPAPNFTPSPEPSVAGVLMDQDKKYGTARKALAGASFMVDVMNANSAYNSTVGQAQLNIMQARNQGSDALFRGRQAQSTAISEGYQNGQSALLNAAAQGQDVNGAGTQKIQGSYEAMGIYNGMREQINSIREALGYELEEVNYDYQMDQAKTARNNAMLGSGLNFATSLAVL